MILLNRYVAIVVILLVSFQSIAQSPIILKNIPSQKISEPSVLWLIDSGEKSDVNIISHSGFSSFPKKEILTAKPSWNVWARFSVVNQTDAYQAFVLQIPKSGYATVYVRTNDSSYELQTGSLLPLTERSIQANTNAFRLFIKSNEKATVWLKMQSVYSIYLPRNYDLTIKTEAEFMRQDNKRLLWQGIFLGVILIMSLYNFFIGVAVKDVSYLYYVLSIVGIGTYFAFYYGFGIEYLWPKRPLWDTFCYLIIVPFSGLMRLLFTRTYLHTPQLLPNTNFLMNILMGLNIFVMSFGLIAYLFKIDIILILIEIIGFTGTAIHLLMLVAGIIAYSEKYRPAKYFIWANLVLVVGAILFIGRELGLLQDNFMTRYLVQIGFLIQVVVFSLGLASRLNAMRGQLAKEMLEKERVALEREREKKELIEQQRKELLVQVEQQTKDLKNKNVELEKSFALVKESENKQTELNELKNKLFSIISHDLRNPLATMQSFLKLITEHHHKLNEDEKQKLFTQAQQSLDNLNLLMYNLLQWSRSQMNLLEFKSEKISVRPILENAATVLQLNAHMKNIAVKVQSEENLCVYADKEMTEFVVRNLISNAIKFSHRNNTIAVKAYQQDNSIVIEVQDSGIGLTENKIKKLLEMNTTVSSRGTEKEKGTGLGLLISKEFIKKNNGRLYIISEPGKGSSFSFTLQKAG